MNRKLLTLTIAGALALGSGAILQAKGPDGEGHGRHGRGDKMGFRVERLTKDLDLTPAQQAQVTPIIEQAKPQIQAIHQEARQKTEAVMADTTAKIRSLLTPEQQAKMDKMKAAHEQMRAAREAMRAARQQ